MNFPLSVATRYLFSRKKAHFINIISGVTIGGLTLGAAALILILSVFNGFQILIQDMISAFNPDLKVTPVKGKFFHSESIDLNAVLGVPGIAAVSETLEEIAFFEYDEIRHYGFIKGVDENFRKVTTIDSTIIEGVIPADASSEYAVVGAGIAQNLRIDPNQPFIPLITYALKENATISMQQPFTRKALTPRAIFAIQQEYDNEYVLAPLDVVQRLLSKKGMISALEIKVAEGSSEDDAAAALRSIVGEGFEVKNRYQQDEDFMKLMNIEKWMAFAVTCLMILLIAFNVIGCLWMIVIDKKKDISMLKAMGADNSQVREIFLYLGALFAGLAFSIGTILAVGLYILQKKYGLISIPQGFVIDAYPIEMKWQDILVVVVTVIIIGVVASIPAARRAQMIESDVREKN